MNPSAKVLLFDLECTHLKADFGHVLCVGYKWFGKRKVYCPTANLKGSALNFRSAERRLLKEFYKVFCEADVIVTYNGKRFDVPYLQAKCLEYNVGILPNTSHVDLYFTVKHNFAISRKSLQNVGYYLNLSAEKTPVEGRIWLSAMAGSPGAFRYIVKHCRADVLILEELYEKIRPLVRQHPRVRGWGPCRSCGSDEIESRGKYTTKLKGPRQRIHCRNCGTWEDRPIPKDSAITRNCYQRAGRSASRNAPLSSRARVKDWKRLHGAMIQYGE